MGHEVWTFDGAPHDISSTGDVGEHHPDGTSALLYCIAVPVTKQPSPLERPDEAFPYMRSAWRTKRCLLCWRRSAARAKAGEAKAAAAPARAPAAPGHPPPDPSGPPSP